MALTDDGGVCDISHFVLKGALVSNRVVKSVIIRKQERKHRRTEEVVRRESLTAEVYTDCQRGGNCVLVGGRLRQLIFCLRHVPRGWAFGG